MSFLRKQESISSWHNWTPACAGVTNWELLEVPKIFKIPPHLPFQREEKHFPLLTKGDEGGLDIMLQKAKVLQ